MTPIRGMGNIFYNCGVARSKARVRQQLKVKGIGEIVWYGGADFAPPHCVCKIVNANLALGRLRFALVKGSALAGAISTRPALYNCARFTRRGAGMRKSGCAARKRGFACTVNYLRINASFGMPCGVSPLPDSARAVSALPCSANERYIIAKPIARTAGVSRSRVPRTSVISLPNPLRGQRSCSADSFRTLLYITLNIIVKKISNF